MLKNKTWNEFFWNTIFAISFLILIPLVEWPDAIFNLSSFNEYSHFKNIPGFLSTSESLVKYPPEINISEFNFFADKYYYSYNHWFILINLERLPLIIAMLAVLSILKIRFNFTTSLFSPTIVFSLCAPSVEIFSIFFLLIAIVVSSRLSLLALFFCILASVIDRSAIPSAFFLSFYTFSAEFRRLSKNIIITSSIILFLIFSSYLKNYILDFISLYSIYFFGIGESDIDYNANYGGYNWGALFFSAAGLFGSMSLRPQPFFIYYPAIILFFCIGFYKSESENRSYFLFWLIPTSIVLMIIPPLSQARYFPILCIFFWDMIVRGAVKTGINFNLFAFFIYSFVLFGLIYAYVARL